MLQIDTNEYISMLLQLLREGHEAALWVSGNSMLPFLVDQRDLVYLQEADRPLKVGDIVLYRRDNGAYILHRICRIAPEGFYAVGDAQQEIEGPLQPDQVLALVFRACRKGKQISQGDFWWEFFEHVWIRMIPCRHALMRLYGIRFPDGKGAAHE